jgi:hypothetical protein
MRWRSPSKPRCSFAKLVSDRHRVRRSLTGQFQTVTLTSQLAGKQPLPRGERHLVIPGRHRVLSTYLSRST